MTGRIRNLDGMTAGAGMASGAAGNAPTQTVRGSTSTGAGTGSAAGMPASDRVDITESARQLAALATAVQSAPQVDSARVSSLQQAIGTSQYHVDPDQLAGRLLQLEQDLAGTQS